MVPFVYPESTLARASLIMAKSSLDNIAVKVDDHIVGVLFRKDIPSLNETLNKNKKDLVVYNYMTQPIVKIDESSTIIDCAKKIIKTDSKALAIQKNKKTLGIISIYVLLDFIISNKKALNNSTPIKSLLK